MIDEFDAIDTTTETAPAEDLILPDGVYFDLDETLYHRLHRMSASALKKVMVSAPTYWAQSWMNPEREEKPRTDAQRYGSAYHCAILEPALFDAKYCKAFTAADMAPGPKCLSSSDVMAALKEMGQAQTKKGESVVEKAERLKALGYPHPIWTLEEPKWRASIGDKVVLTEGEHDAITRDQEVMLGIKDIADLFTDGFAEVSVLWTDPDSGIQFKARMDYLKVDGYNDLKTYANPMDKITRNHLKDAFRFNGYYVQWVLYWKAYEAIRAGLEAAEGSTAEQEMMIELIHQREIPGQAHFAFQEKGGIPNGFKVTPLIYGAQLTQADDGALYYGDAMIKSGTMPAIQHSELFRRGLYDIYNASYTFQTYLKKYGDEGALWYPLETSIELSDADYPDFFLDPEGERA